MGGENGSLVSKEGMRDGGMSCVGKGLKRARVVHASPCASLIDMTGIRKLIA